LGLEHPQDCGQDGIGIDEDITAHEALVDAGTLAFEPARLQVDDDQRVERIQCHPRTQG
jgi:hypothetical protein